MKTEVIKLDPERPEKSRLEQAAKAIDQGKLVVFPTETVYGIGCKVAKDTLNRLSEVKKRSTAKYYTLHIGRQTELHRYLPRVIMKARKLIRNVWPGPVTIIFELSSDDMFSQHEKLPAEVFENLYKNASLGVRCPDNRTASGVLQLSESPIVAPSANEADKEPATNAEKALAELDGKVDMLLDAGSCYYGKSSTVVRVKSTGLEIIREGVYSAKRLKEASRVQILFVCTGNTCRSPMAEGIFRHYLAKKLNCDVDESQQMGYKVLSAGVMERVGYPATSEAVEACAKKGIDISSHRSQTLSKSLIDNSDVIFGMTERHCSEVKKLSPDAAEKCLLLAEQQNITDPIGQPQQAYDFCADIIEKAIKKRIEELQI